MKFLFLIFFSFPLFSQDKIDQKQLESYISGSIDYLVDTQVKETVGTEKFKGEWPSYMKLNRKVFKLGDKGKIAYDSNAFTSSSVMSSLTEVLLLRPEYSTRISPMLEKAVPQLLTYKVNDAFGFWPLLDRPEHLNKNKEDPSVKLRRPNNFYLRDTFINNSANIPEDADDTAMAYVALSKIKKINEAYKDGFKVEVPHSIKDLFDRYQDINRKNVHFYNITHGNHTQTGAYLTWLEKEKPISPLSWLPKDHTKPYIPFGSNEVDCVVNANVLYALAVYDELDAEGVKSSCDFLNKVISKKEFGQCGLYYPNRYHFHYTVSRALNNGASCLDKSLGLILEDILEHQNDEGYLDTPNTVKGFNKIINLFKGIGKDDPINQCSLEDNSWLDGYDPLDRLQSTINASYSMMELYNRADQEQKKKISAAMEKSIGYILKNATKKEGKVFWKGGVFFSGGAVVRDELNWHSDAYTTAMVTELLTKYSNIQNKISQK